MAKLKRTSFNYRVKAEIINHNRFEQPQLLAILAAYLYNNFALMIDQKTHDLQFYLTDFHPLVLGFVQTIIQTNWGSKVNLQINSKNKINKLIIDDHVIIDELQHFSEQLLVLGINPDYYGAILIGFFLGFGTICDFVQKKLYHLEFNFKTQEQVVVITKILDHFQIKFKHSVYHERKRPHRILIARFQDVSNLLLLLHAENTMLSIEETFITKDYINQHQKLVNLEIANISKVTKSSTEQIQMIQFLQEKKLLSLLNHKQQLFVQLRLSNPMASYMELVKLFWNQHQLKITKSNLNHMVRKIKLIYQKYRLK